MFWRHPIWAGLLGAALLAACTVPFRSAPQEQAAPPPASISVAASADPFLVLLPRQDLQLQMKVQDHGAQPVVIDEEWMRDDSQRALIATYAGTPYVRWEWNDEGLWRLDPKGGGAMLRYLPPTLEDGAVWRQLSGDEIVWFHLTRLAAPCAVPGAAGDSAECWELAVLNRGEFLRFTFARGVGPIAAIAEHYARRAESFTKELVEVRPTQLTPEQRTALIAELAPSGRPTAPVQTATLHEFKAAQAAVRGEEVTDR